MISAQSLPTNSTAPLPPDSASFVSGRLPVWLTGSKTVMALVFALMTLVSWRRWTSAIVDTGREMDLPLRLLNGEWLYRDVHYLYPPLSPYFNALLYRVFGAHLDVLHVNGILCGLLIVWLSYRLARRVMSEAHATLTAVMVIVWCIFKPGGNLISPYAFAALHGMLLSLAALLFTLRYGETRQRRELLLVGVFIGLAAITKQECAFTSAVTVTAALLWLHRSGSGLRAKLKSFIVELLLTALPAVLIALPVYVAMFSLIGAQTLIEDCHLLYTHLPPSLIAYNAQRTGLDRPLSSLLQMLGGAAMGFVFLSVIVLLSLWRLKREQRSLPAKLWRRAMLLLTGSAMVALLIRLVSAGRWDGSPLRSLPFLLIGILFLCWCKSTATTDSSTIQRSQRYALFVIATYSLTILSRVVLRVPSGGAFGGFFLPASLLLLCWLLVEALPNLLHRWSNADERLGTLTRQTSRAFILVLLFVTIIVFAVRYRRTYTYEVVAPHGRLIVIEPEGRALTEAIEFLRTHTTDNEAIVVAPEGSTITFLSGRHMPLRHQIMIPEFMNAQEEQAAIAQMQQNKVRYVLIVNRPMREFGREAFGRDYYQTLGEWISQHYQLVKVCGQSVARPEDAAIGDPKFFVKIFEKKIQEEKPRINTN